MSEHSLLEFSRVSRLLLELLGKWNAGATSLGCGGCGGGGALTASASLSKFIPLRIEEGMCERKNVDAKDGSFRSKSPHVDFLNSQTSNGTDEHRDPRGWARRNGRGNFHQCFLPLHRLTVEHLKVEKSTWSSNSSGGGSSLFLRYNSDSPVRFSVAPQLWRRRKKELLPVVSELSSPHNGSTHSQRLTFPKSSGPSHWTCLLQRNIHPNKIFSLTSSQGVLPFCLQLGKMSSRGNNPSSTRGPPCVGMNAVLD